MIFNVCVLTKWTSFWSAVYDFSWKINSKPEWLHDLWSCFCVCLPNIQHTQKQLHKSYNHCGLWSYEVVFVCVCVCVCVCPIYNTALMGIKTGGCLKLSWFSNNFLQYHVYYITILHINVIVIKISLFR
jgi:hypothetical protein